MVISTKQFLKTLWRCFGDGVETKFGWFLSDEKLILETPAFKLCPGGQLELSIQISYKIFRSLLFDGCWDTDMAALTSH